MNTPLVMLMPGLAAHGSDLVTLLNDPAHPAVQALFQMPQGRWMEARATMTLSYPYMAGVEQGGRVLVLQFAARPDGTTVQDLAQAVAAAIPDVALFAQKLAAFDLSATGPI